MADKNELIERYLELSEFSNRVMDHFNKLFARSGVAENFTPEISEQIKHELAFLMRSQMEELLQRIAKVYDNVYTKEEMAAMVEFHSTTVGRAILAKETRLVEEQMGTVEKWVAPLIERVTTNLQRLN